MRFTINSLYICVIDMGRAIHFYESLFEQQVTERDEIYSVFDIQGFRFGLFAYRQVNEAHSYGDNCLPSFSVDHLDQLLNKIEALGCPIVFP